MNEHYRGRLTSDQTVVPSPNCSLEGGSIRWRAQQVPLRGHNISLHTNNETTI